MKNLFFLSALFLSFQLYSQSDKDQNRIILNSFVIDKDNNLPLEAKNTMKTKLEQIASNNGIGGYSINPRFIIAAKINILTKDIIAGPPPMVAVNADIVFFIGDGINSQVFSNTTISVKGVGTNENKAMINAVQQISPSNKSFIDLVNVGKAKIVNYYLEKCDFIVQKAKTLSQQRKYDEAIYELMQVPEVCKSCYEKSITLIQPIFQAKIDNESVLALNKAKNSWNSNPNRKGAEDVAALLANIYPSSFAYKDAVSFSEIIRRKIETDEKKEWEFYMKKYNDDVSIKQFKIESAMKVAIAYFENQPKFIYYNNFQWR